MERKTPKRTPPSLQINAICLSLNNVQRCYLNKVSTSSVIHNPVMAQLNVGRPMDRIGDQLSSQHELQCSILQHDGITHNLPCRENWQILNLRNQGCSICGMTCHTWEDYENWQILNVNGNSSFYFRTGQTHCVQVYAH